MKFFQYARLGILFAVSGAITLCAETNNAATNVTAYAMIGSYHGESVKGVDVSTLTHKVMCGYQGWFAAPGDGHPGGWRHWTKHAGPMADGNAKVDLWPDVSELSAGERIATDFKMADGKPAQVFSSFERSTVLRHFHWMQEYGIDGVFVQRFAGEVRNPDLLKTINTVLGNCRAGANLYGRAYAVMYDLSGLRHGQMEMVMNDWRALRREMDITGDAAYLHHRGKPVVAVWGIGFNDHRDYTLAECKELIEFLKKDGCTVMIGVPTYWREQKRDTVTDPELQDVIRAADIVSPWTVGRFSDPEGARKYAEDTAAADQKLCHEHRQDFLPVVFPGFSWHNMYGAKLNAIPRLRGKFLWSQFLAMKRMEASMVYVAMFDEVDEGTAIFKCSNEVPDGPLSQFATFEGLPSDYYLKLVGAGGQMMRQQIPMQDEPPVREK